MTKKELEIRCKVLEEKIERINELCKEYKDTRDAAETIGAIIANCDPDLIEKSIKFKLL